MHVTLLRACQSTLAHHPQDNAILDFITRNCVFISLKSEKVRIVRYKTKFISWNSDLVTHNCKFIYPNYFYIYIYLYYKKLELQEANTQFQEKMSELWAKKLQWPFFFYSVTGAGFHGKQFLLNKVHYLIDYLCLYVFVIKCMNYLHTSFNPLWVY